MGSIYRESGLANAPAFFSYTPFRLDFSPYRRNQELMMQMMPALLEQQQQTAAAARAKKMPELDGLAVDVTPRYERAMAAKAGMSARMNAGMNHMWVAKNDPEFQQYQQDYLQAISPADQLLLKEQKAGLESADEYIKANRNDGAPSFLFTDGSGRIVTSPYDESAPLTLGDATFMRRNDPNSNVDSYGKDWDFRNMVPGNTQKFKERLTKNMSTGAFNEWSGSGKQDSQALAQLAQATNAGMTSVLANVVMNSRGKSNKAQLSAALNAEMGSWDEEARAAVRNEFVQQNGLTNKDGDPLYVDDEGRFSQQKLDDAIFNSQSYDAPLVGKTSFAGRFVAEQAARHLASSNLVNPELVKSFAANGGDGSGSGGSIPKLIPLIEALEHIPHTTDEAGNVRMHATTSDMTVPVAVRKGGKDSVIGMAVPNGQATYKLPLTFVEKINHQVKSAVSVEGVDANNSDIYGNAKVGTVSKIFSGREVLTEGGMKLSADHPAFKNAKILEVTPDLVYRKPWDYSAAADPDVARSMGVSYGSVDTSFGKSTFDKPTLTATGISANQPNKRYLKVEVALDDDDAVMPEYKRVHAQGDIQENPYPTLEPSSIEDDPGSSIPRSFWDMGQEDRTTILYVEVTDGDELMRGEGYMVDPAALIDYGSPNAQPSQQEVQQAQATYDSIIKGVLQPTTP